MNRLAEVLDRSEPTMAVSFSGPLDDVALEAIAEVTDVAELRADMFPSLHDPVYLAEQAGRLSVLPLLLTIRYEAERGEWTGTEDERFEMFTELIPYSDGVDIEIAAEISRDVIELAHSQGKVAVASFHDFDEIPPDQEIYDMLAQATNDGADYVKIAASAKTNEEFNRLAEFTLDNQGENLIVVAMDAYGPLSRIALPAMGSHLVYAFAGEVAVAPGQLGYVETHELLKRFYPDYAKLFEQQVT